MVIYDNQANGAPTVHAPPGGCTISTGVAPTAIGQCRSYLRLEQIQYKCVNGDQIYKPPMFLI